MSRAFARAVKPDVFGTQIITIPAGAHTRVRIPLPNGGHAMLVMSVRGRTVAVEVLDVEAPVLLDGLSPRERDVALLVAEGLGNREIAQRLGVKPATVASHLVRIYRKLHLGGRYDLVLTVLRGSRGSTSPTLARTTARV